MIVIVGLLREAAEAQFCSVTTFFLVFVAGIFVISAFLHPQVNNKMKIINKKYNTVGTVPKSNKEKSQTEAISILLTHKYITAYVPSLVSAL